MSISRCISVSIQGHLIKVALGLYSGYWIGLNATKARSVARSLNHLADQLDQQPKAEGRNYG